MWIMLADTRGVLHTRDTRRPGLAYCQADDAPERWRPMGIPPGLLLPSCHACLLVLHPDHAKECRGERCVRSREGANAPNIRRMVRTVAGMESAPAAEEVVCPRCGTRMLPVRIVYGVPSEDAPRVGADRVRGPGYVVPGQPTHRCRACQAGLILEGGEVSVAPEAG